MNKAIIRKKYLFQRQQHSLKSVSSMSARIIEQVLNSDWYNDAKSVFTYVSFKNEVDTIYMILKAFEEGKKVAVPKTYGKGIMKFYFINALEDLEIGKLGLLEPIKTTIEAIPDETTLLLVPGVVFDYSCNRIGYGAGYYDQYLSRFHLYKKIGLAFEEQVTESIPCDEYDVPMDMIFTEVNQYYKNKKSSI